MELSGKLKGYRGEDHWEASDVAQTFCMFDLGLAPKPVLLPLLAFTFLSPLNHFLREAECEPKFTLFLLGRTGSRKSTLAALFLSFFGEFTASSLPLSFQDTANSILHQLFSTKDVLTCVDDFHPDGAGGVVKMTATAQAVMRAYGDRVGKGRLTDQSTPMEDLFHPLRSPEELAPAEKDGAGDLFQNSTAKLFLFLPDLFRGWAVTGTAGQRTVGTADLFHPVAGETDPQDAPPFLSVFLESVPEAISGPLAIAGFPGRQTSSPLGKRGLRFAKSSIAFVRLWRALVAGGDRSAPTEPTGETRLFGATPRSPYKNKERFNERSQQE